MQDTEKSSEYYLMKMFYLIDFQKSGKLQVHIEFEVQMICNLHLLIFTI